MVSGAAIQAAQIVGSLQRSKDFKFLDILPLSLGTNLRGGITSIIIPRKTPIPATHTKGYITTADNQSSFRFKLLEGERLMVVDNNLMGEMVLSGIQPLPAREATADVTFTIDENGSLHAKAVERSTGLSTTVTIHYTQKRLGNVDMQQMIADAKRLKMEDQKKVEDAEARNELEAYCLKIQKRVNNNRDMTEDEKSFVAGECRNALDWLKVESRSKELCMLKKKSLKRTYSDTARKT